MLNRFIDLRVPLAMLILLGCTEELDKGRCRQQTDCEADQMCNDFRRCVSVARADGGNARRDAAGDGGDRPVTGDGSPAMADAAPDAAGTCSGNADCPDASGVCASGRCVACTEDSHCADPLKRFCVMNSCVDCSLAPPDTCATKGTGNNKRCAMATGACVECLEASQCTAPGKTFCVAGACSGCMAAGADACKAPTPVCEAGGSCVECTAAGHCKDPTKPFCAASKCVGCGMAAGQTCASLDPAKPACGPGGDCVECNTSADCKAPARPICQAARCVACTADTQCVAKLGPSPGVCLAHLDGRCATEAETIHVRAGSGCGGGGTTAQPVCELDGARPLINAGRRLVLVHGLVQGFTWSLPSGGPVTIIGRDQPVIAGGARAGGRLTGTGEIWLRDLAFSSSALQGLVAEPGVNLHADRLLVEGNRGGGILLDGARFHLRDTVVNDNGPGQQGATAWGGILVQSPPPGGGRLERVSVTKNRQIGLSCSGTIQGTGVYASENVGGEIAPTCGLAACPAAGGGCGAGP
jgi:hypothetical protein